MGKNKKQRKPNVFDPNLPGAVGSVNSPLSAGRDQDREAERMMDDALKKIMGGGKKLPSKALKKMDVMPSVKDKLDNYVNINQVNTTARYLTTAEDEMAKKFRDQVDQEEERIRNKKN